MASESPLCLSNLTYVAWLEQTIRLLKYFYHPDPAPLQSLAYHLRGAILTVRAEGAVMRHLVNVLKKTTAKLDSGI
jgi:hypothetical protein